MPMFCPKCNLVDSDIGNCGNTVIPCPKPIPVDQEKHIQIACRPCGVNIVVPVGNLMLKRHCDGMYCKGETSDCKAIVLHPSSKKGNAKDGRQAEG